MDTENQKTFQLNKLKDKIADVEIAMLTTENEDGYLVSRPMTSAKMDEDGNVWFITDKPSGKVSQISQQHQVNLSYSDPNNHTYVSIAGKAEIVNDDTKKEKLWSPILKAWYPDGLADSNIVLLKVSIVSAEYWDSSANKMVQLFHIAKAVATGEQYHEGENARFNA